MSKKLTEWFPADVKPVRKGLYQRNYIGYGITKVPDRWDGKKWWVRYADGSGEFPAKTNRPWRGLASDPSKGTV